MKIIKIAFAVLLLLLFLPARAAADPADANFSYYLPLVSRLIPPERLGPFLGSVMTLAADPLNLGVLYAGTWGSGIYKSTDRGETWAPINAGLANLLIQALAVDQINPAYVYAGTYYDYSAVYSGVYRSKTGGQAWQPGGQMLNTYNGQKISRPVVYALAADPLNGGVVYAGTRMKDLVPGEAIYGGGGVFKSPDHGATWLTANAGLPPDDLYIYDLSINPKNSSQVYAAVHVSGAFATDNAGASWYNLHAPDTSGRVIAVDPLNPLTVMFGVWHGMGLFRSDNRGASWRGSGLSGLRLEGLAVDPTNSNYVYASTSVSIVGIPQGLYASSNNGKNWSASSLNPSITKALVDPFDGSYVYAGTVYSGMLRSLDHGASWNYSNWGLSGFSVTGMAVNPANPAVIYAALNQWGVMKSQDRGVSWTQSSNGLPALANLTGLVMDPADPQVLYVSTSDAGVYSSRNGAATWAQISSGYPGALAAQSRPGSQADQSASTAQDLSDPLHNRPAPPVQERDQDTLPSMQAVASVASASGLSLTVSPWPSRAVLAGTLGKGITRLAGASWSTTSLTSGNVYALFYDQSGKAFAGVGAGSGSLLVSANDGKTWTPSAAGLAGRTVYAVDQSKLQPNLYYAGTDSGLYRSEDGGASWAPAGLAGQVVTAVRAHLTLPDAVILGTPSALYSSPDKGASWQAVESSLDNFGIQSILPDPADNHFFYLATRFGGVVRILR